MEWKLVSEHTPKISVMENSQHDLIIWDGKDYHRGFGKAIYNRNRNENNDFVYNVEYFSHETSKYIDAIMFLEIEPAKKGLAQNIWKTL